MAITRYAGDRFTANTGDTRPTGVLQGAFLINTGNQTSYVKTGNSSIESDWAALQGGGGGGGSPSGDNFTVQFNDGGVFGGDADLTFTDGNRLNVNKLGISGNVYDSNNWVGEGGMILANEGATGVNWKNIESVLSGVGGSGVANYVARWSDEDTLTSGALVDDGTKVGIGTPTPDDILDVTTTNGQLLASDYGVLKLIRGTAGDYGSALQFIKSDNGGAVTDGAILGSVRFFGHDGIDTATEGAQIASIINGTPSANVNPTDIVFKTASTGNDDLAEKVRIMSNGKVGIGTNAPNELLEIFNSTANGNAKIRLSAEGDSTGERALEFFEGEYNRWRIATVGANGNFEIHRSTTGNSWVAVPAISINKADGNVGIGTTAPAGKLHIETTANEKSLWIAPSAATTSNIFTIEGDSLTTGSAAYFHSNNYNTGTRKLVYINNDHAAATGTTALYITQDSTGPALVALGNVGIGTDAPGGRLDVGTGYMVNEQGRQDHVANTLPQPYYRFDGANDYIALTSQALAGIFTISMWINPDDVTGANLLGLSSANTDYLWINSSGEVDLKSADIDIEFTDSNITAGVWQHICITRDGSNIPKFYKNGVLVQTLGADAGTFTFDQIGRYYDGGNANFFVGSISDVKIHNLALSDTEIKELYSGASVPFKYKGANNTHRITNGTATYFDSVNASGRSSSTTAIEFTTTSWGKGCLSYSATLEKGKIYRITFTGVSATGSGCIVRMGTGLGSSADSEAIATSGNWFDTPVGFTAIPYAFTTLSNYGGHWLGLGTEVCITFKNYDNAATTTVTNLSVIEVGCVAEYDGSGMTGDTWYDKSGNNVDGTVYGASLENRATALVLDDRLLLPLANIPATPTLAFGDGDSGFYEVLDDNLRVGLAGASTYEISLFGLGSSNEAKPWMRLVTPTATVPNLIPWRNDDDTGIGWHSANRLSLVAGGAGTVTVTSTSVGIGTTNPATTLHVNKATGGTDIRISADNYGTDFGEIGIDSAALHLRAGGQNNAISILHSNRYVGIGTATPSDKLEVYASGADVALRIHEDAGSHEAKLHLRRGGSDWEIINNNQLAIETEGTEVFRITTVGNVGIGDNLIAPAHRLHVSGDAIISGVLYDSTNSSGDLGEVLTSEVGGPQWKMIEDVLSGVGGNGTANYVPKWEDSDTIGNSVIYDDGGDVGISTVTPSGKFHVYGGAGRFDVTSAATKDHHLTVSEGNPTDWRNYAGSTTAALQLQNSATRGLLLLAKSEGNQELTTSDGFDVNVNATIGTNNGSLAVRVASDGNVGIGTTNPGAKLDVFGSARFTASSGDPIWIAANQNIKIFASETYNRNLEFNMYDSGTTSYRTVLFLEGATTGKGSVGIGTNAPDRLLHIYKATAGSVTATSDSQLVVENSAIAGIQLLGGAGSHGIIYFGNSGDNEDGRIGYDQSDQAFYFKTAGDNTKKVFINSAGNVGIGDNLVAPQHRLHVSGDAIISGKFYDQTNSTGDKGYVLTSDDNGPLWKASGDFDGLSGNLIATGQTLTNLIASTGTTNAAGIVTNASAIADNTSNLILTGAIVDDISGNLIATGTTNAAAIVTNASAIAANTSNLILTGAIVDDVSGNLIATGQYLTDEINTVSGLIPATVIDGGGTADYIPKWTDGNTIGDSVMAQSGSAIGIGTAAPDTPLHVYSTANDVLKIQGGDHVRVLIDGTDSSEKSLNFSEAGSLMWKLGMENIAPFEAFVIKNNDNGAPQFLIDYSTGKVGIGTTNPGYLLHLEDAGSDLLKLKSTGSGSSNAPRILFEHNSGGTQSADIVFDQLEQNTLKFTTYYESGSDLNRIQFAPANSVALTICGGTNAAGKDGFVGIGTDAPGVNLDVVPAAGSGNIRVKGQSTSDASLVFNEVGVGDVGKIGWDGSEGLLKIGKDFSKNGLVVNTTSNKVGIGVALDPQHNLHVSGDAIISGYLYDSTNSTGTDGYVFTTKENGPRWEAIEDVLSGVGGNGTANYIPKWEDSDTIGNSIIYDNGSNIGIGNAVPSGTLDIVGSNGTVDVAADGDAQELVIRNNDRAGIQILSSEVNGKWGSLNFGSASDANGANIFYEPYTKLLRIGTQIAGGQVVFRAANGAEAVRIDAAGKVGIGTTNPVQELDVRGNIYISSGNRITWANGDAEIIEGATSNYSLTFNTYDGVSAMSTNLFLESGGNVGIGTDAPATILHIASTSVPTLRIHHDSTSSAAALIQLMRGTTDTFGGDAYTDWQLHNVGGDLKFQYNDTAAGSLQTPFAISYLGAVTIGAYTLPTADGTAGYHLQTDGAGTVTWAAGGAGTVTSVTAGTGMTQTGTSTVNPTLNVIGGTGITANANDIAITDTAVSAGSYTYSSITVDAQGRLTAASSGSAPGGGTVTGTGTDNYVPRWNGTTALQNSAIISTDAGLVGIGTTAPGAKLHTFVDGGPNEFRMQAHRNDVGQNMFSTQFSRGSAASPAIVQNGDTLLEIQPKGYDGANYHRAAEIDFQVDGTPGTNDMPGRIVFWTTADGASAPTEHMRITSAGNVGIGTTAPGAYKLNVQGNVYISGTLTEASSLGIKENVETYTPSLEIINKLRPVRYNKKKSKKKEVGLVAEELAEMFPELVERDEKGNPSGVNYSRAVAVLLHGFKELYKEVKELKEKI